MDDNLKEIQDIENKYGLILFRMGLSHLMDIGIRNMDDGYLDEAIKQILTKEEDYKATGKIAVMTPEFQMEILHCSFELSKYSIWTLFTYIKKYIEISI